MDFYLDENIFKNPEKSEKEQKGLKGKKKKKNKKGIDFIEYAKDKGIDFNIEYENTEPSHDYLKGNNQYYKDQRRKKNWNQYQGKDKQQQLHQQHHQQNHSKQQNHDQQPQLQGDLMNAEHSNSNQQQQQQQRQQERQFHQVKTNKFDQTDNKKQQQQQHMNNQMLPPSMMNNQGGYQQTGYNMNMNMNNMNSNSNIIMNQTQWYEQQQQQMAIQAQQQKNYLYQQQKVPQWNSQYQQMDNGAILISTLEFLFSFDNIKVDRLLCLMMNNEGYVALPQLSTHPRLQKFILSKEIIEDLFNKVTYTEVELRETYDGIVLFRNKNWNAYMGGGQSMSMKINQYDNMQNMLMTPIYNNNPNMLSGKNYPQQFNPYQRPQQQYYPNANTK